MHAYMHTYTHTYIRTYIHTCIHTYIHHTFDLKYSISFATSSKHWQAFTWIIGSVCWKWITDFGSCNYLRWKHVYQDKSKPLEQEVLPITAESHICRAELCLYTSTSPTTARRRIETDSQWELFLCISSLLHQNTYKAIQTASLK
jgi:hypothetical protein